jgi:hypothetical protein
MEVTCLEDLPIRVLDVLKIFLAASSRGEVDVLVLETKDMTVNTKYRSVDNVVGMPACPTNAPRRRRTNPARAMRSKLRLEKFVQKKLEEKAKLEDQTNGDINATGASSSSTNRLILELAKQDKPVDTGLPSPILQVDGLMESESVKYSFESTYHEDDVTYTLEELFPATEIKLTLESRDKVAPRSNREIFVIQLEVKIDVTGRKLSWPDMNEDQAPVFENVERIL